MRPRVIIHNTVSVDGRMDWFQPDIGLYYRLVSRWEEDATLAGSNTILAGDVPEEESDESPKPWKADPDDTRPLLVVPDSRGRVRTWDFLRQAGYWRDVVALCSRTTPGSYLGYLRERQVQHITAGDDQVDLAVALEELNARYGVKVVRVDSGGTLSGVLLRAGLVDEVSVLVSPSLVGGTTPRSIFHAPDLTSADGVVELSLVHVERLESDAVWLRYEVTR